MTLLMDSADFGDIIGLTCMGQEGTQWIGMAPFVDTPHIFQNIGDGTYFHSGQLAVQGAVAAGVDITYKLLWNRAVAMTGGQDPQGLITVGNVARVLLAQGVARVLITTDDTARYRGADVPDNVEVWPRSRLLEAQKMLALDQGRHRAHVHDQQCAAEARRGRKRGTVAVPRQRVFINERICEGCGDCAQISNCLSVQPVETPFGRKTRIDQTTCNLDFSCLEGDCPSFINGHAAGAAADPAAPDPVAGPRTHPGRRARPRPPRPPTVDDPVPVVPTDELSVRIVGIGGTGVVTVSQVIGTAAMFDGYNVRGLDQIGLSQKAGPVVSDLRLGRGGEAASNRLGSGQADVLLAFDQLGAASPAGMSRCDPQRTVVVGSRSQTPTGAVIANPERGMPDPAELEAAIAAVTRADCRRWVDAQRVCEALLQNAVAANILVVGMAVQAGALPLSPRSVEQAIELNGVAVQSNIEAFRWGRAVVERPTDVASAVESSRASGRRLADLDEDIAQRSGAITGAVGAGAPDLDEDIAQRSAAITGAVGAGAPDDAGYRGGFDLELMAGELCAYQSPQLARRHLDFVEAVAAADVERGDGSGRLTVAAARGYFKLLAYKDEYEVARLMLDPEATAGARELAAATGGRVAWKLHPPILRALGMRSKIAVPVSWTPLIRVLAAMRRLRGTVLDPFGHTAVRRAERSLPGEYRAAVESDLRHLSGQRYSAALQRATLPEEVRGYEHIKMGAIDRIREELNRA